MSYQVCTYWLIIGLTTILCGALGCSSRSSLSQADAQQEASKAREILLNSKACKAFLHVEKWLTLEERDQAVHMLEQMLSDPNSRFAIKMDKHKMEPDLAFTFYDGNPSHAEKADFTLSFWGYSYNHPLLIEIHPNIKSGIKPLLFCPTPSVESEIRAFALKLEKTAAVPPSDTQEHTRDPVDNTQSPKE